MKKRQIIAIGGAGFSTEPNNPLLEEYMLKQTGKSNPSVCFLPTASGDANAYIVRFYTVFSKLKCKPTHLSLFQRTEDLKLFLLSQDVIYVGGGNTKSMLALWREWKLDAILRKAWREGVVLAGVSAGSICWFEEGVTDSITGKLTALPCLGLLKGSNCPHYDSETERRPAYQRLVRSGKMHSGLAADDGVALHFVGQKLTAVVSSRAHAAVYRVRRHGSQVTEKRIAPKYLGNNKN